MTTPERRRQHRIPVGAPVKIRSKGGNGSEQSGLTRDLSTSGVFLYSESALEAGAKLELVIMFPPGLGLGPGGWTLCEASVVRIEEEEESDGKRVGVAATLDRIELLPELT